MRPRPLRRSLHQSGQRERMPPLINGAHAILYSDGADATRATVAIALRTGVSHRVLRACSADRALRRTAERPAGTSRWR
jgi:hypothetical protein